MLTVTLREAYGYHSITFCRRKECLGTALSSRLHMPRCLKPEHALTSEHVLAAARCQKPEVPEACAALMSEHILAYSKLLTGLLTVTLRYPYGSLRNARVFKTCYHLTGLLTVTLRYPYGTLRNSAFSKSRGNRVVMENQCYQNNNVNPF